MGRKKVLTQVHLEEDQLQRLNRLRDETRVPTAVRIRDAIEEYLRKFEQESGRRVQG